MTKRQIATTLALIISQCYISATDADDSKIANTAVNPMVANDAVKECWLNALHSATATTTVGELKQLCDQVAQQVASDHNSALERRIRAEKISEQNPFVITPNKPNYVMPISYNFDPNEIPFHIEDELFDNAEVKFQVSIKMPLVTGLLDGQMDIYAGYTNRSWWQAYNKDISAPFRETNHEPEFFVNYYPAMTPLGFDSSFLSIGLAHQSNGQAGELSRSWNRSYLNYAMSKGNFALVLSLWNRINEDAKDPNLAYDPSGDDNPDLIDYFGHGQLGFGYTWQQQEVTAFVRNGFSSKRAIEINYTFPITNRINGIVQYFDGYGESLIDYNVSTQRLGIGFALTDWL